MMMKKLMMVAGCAIVVLMGSGVAQADPAPGPGPQPNGPKCWTENNEGHRQLTPCGWAYSDSQGWYQVPWGFQAM